MDGLFGGRNRFKDQGGSLDKFGLYPNDLIPYETQLVLNDAVVNPELFPNLHDAIIRTIEMDLKAIKILNNELDLMDTEQVDYDSEYYKAITKEIGVIETDVGKLMSYGPTNATVYALDQRFLPSRHADSHLTTNMPSVEVLFLEVDRVFRLDQGFSSEVPIAIYVESLQFDEFDKLNHFEIRVHVPKSQATYSYIELFGFDSSLIVESEVEGGRLWLQIDGENEFYWDEQMNKFIQRLDIEGEDDQMV